MTDLVPLLTTATAIVGTTGAGKTFTARGAVEQLLDLGRRVIIIDPTGVWWGLRSGPEDNPDGAGFPVVIFGGDHADIAITEHDGKAIAEAMATRQVQAIIDVSEMTGGEKTRFLTDFFETLYAKNKGALHLVVDEADEVAPQNPMPETRRLSGVFDKIVRRGRVKGFRPLMLTQRPAVLHKNVLSQIGTLIALKLTSPQDRKAIEDWVSGNADAGQAKEVMKSLPQLDRGEGWVWSPAEGVLERQRFPRITTFDSGRTPEDGEVPVAPTMSWVDVEELQQAMFSSRPSQEAQKLDVAGVSAQIEAEHKRGFELGYEAGLADGIERGKVSGIALGLVRARAALDALQIPAIAEGPEKSSNPAPAKTLTKPISPSSPRTNLVSDEKEPSTPGGTSLRPSLQRCLDALGWWKAIGFDEIERDRASIVAGFSPTASTFGVYISQLQKLGMVEAGQPGKLRLTSVGAEKARQPAYTSADALLDMARAQLGNQAAKVLVLIAQQHPGTISRGDLADSMGLSRTASTLGVYLSEASRLGFIENAGPGEVRAVDWLFPKIGAA